MLSMHGYRAHIGKFTHACIVTDASYISERKMQPIYLRLVPTSELSIKFIPKNQEPGTTYPGCPKTRFMGFN